MKNWLNRCVLILAVLILAGAGIRTDAAKKKVQPKKIAYINGENQLVVKFNGFSQGGYTYVLTNLSTNKKTSGNLSMNGSEARVDLGASGLYQANCVYRLKFKSGKKYMLTYFYTGSGFNGANFQENGSKVRTSWSLTGKNYPSYEAAVMANGTSLRVLAKKKTTSNSARSLAVSGKNLSTGTYDVLIHGTAKKKGFNCHGYGVVSAVSYLQKPSRVSGVTATPNTHQVKLSWNRAKGASYYAVYYKKAGGKYQLYHGAYPQTSVLINGLEAGTTYSFKIRAIADVGGVKKNGSYSIAVRATVPKVAGKVKSPTMTLSSSYKLTLTWKKKKLATSYVVYYKKANEANYRKFAAVKKPRCILSRLDQNTNYSLIVYARTKFGGRNYVSNEPSDPINVTPSVYMKQNYNQLIASRVRTVSYRNGRVIYTTKKYPRQLKEAFVNYKGYSSKTKYLIWISHYTQQTTIFTGYKGHWKQSRSFTCATGSYSTRSPRGVSHISRKEKGWYYINTKCMYVSHYWGRNSFHSRPLYHDGSVASPTLGHPVSHGCVRCPTEQARYIYKSIPSGTTVVSY